MPTDPVDLAVTETGTEHSGLPVVVAHGLFGSARNWAAVTKAMPRRVIAVDMRNHGASPWAEGMDYISQAGDLIRLLETVGPAQLLGHSMGGKASMVAALTRPDLVERLVVADIAPVTYPLRYTDYLAAMKALDIWGLRRRAEADAALAEAVADPGERSFLVQNLVPEDGGGFRWRINLEAIERGLPDLVAFPEPNPGAVFEGPTLFVAGAQSDYIRRDHRPIIQGLFPNSRTVTIKNAGHWVHAQAPEAFLASILPFLSV